MVADVTRIVAFTGVVIALVLAYQFALGQLEAYLADRRQRRREARSEQEMREWLAGHRALREQSRRSEPPPEE